VTSPGGATGPTALDSAATGGLTVVVVAVFTIGEVARLANAPVKTLRYYDDIRLFAPADVEAGITNSSSATGSKVWSSPGEGSPRATTNCTDSRSAPDADVVAETVLT